MPGIKTRLFLLLFNLLPVARICLNSVHLTYRPGSELRMNCPKCGLPAAPEQKFCRSCGESLQMITQRLHDPAVISHLESQTAIYTREETDRPNRLVSWGLIIMFLGASIGVVGKKLMHEDVVTVIGVLIAFAGMFLSIYPYVLLPTRGKHRGSPSSESEVKGQSEQKSLPQERTTEYVPGITERTTDLLTNSVVTRKQPEAKKSQE